jgi:hypothetical protein
MSAENHVASMICGAVVWVHGQVVEELVHGNIGGFSGCGLLGAQGAEGGKKFVVDSACIVEESAKDALNSFDTFCGERRAVGINMGELCGLAKHDFTMFVRRELALSGHEMLVPGADVGDISWHGEATRAFSVNWAVVPFEHHAGKAGALDFLRDFVVLFESLAKMIQVSITNVLDGKVIDNECTQDRALFVAPEPGGGGCFVVVKIGEVVLEEFVGKDAFLGETIHATAHFKVDPRVAGNLVELVLVDEFLGNVHKLDAGVLWLVKRGVQIEVLEVHGGKPGICWERTLLTSNLTHSIEPVGVPTSRGYAMLFPPTVMHVHLASSPFSG